MVTNNAHAQAPTQNPQQLFKTRLDTLNQQKREAIATKSATGMEEFKKRMAEIRDARKKAIVERIAVKIPNANTRLTNKMTDALTKLTQILNRIKNKAANLAASGQNTTALYTAITEAETAIASAKAAVEEQASKEYSANITTDAGLRSVIGQMVSQFRLDIQAVHKLMVEARQAVAEAIAEAAKLGGIGNTNATNAGTLIP